MSASSAKKIKLDGREWVERTINLTPQTCEWFLKLLEVPAERAKVESHSENLGEEMDEGHFSWEHVILMTAEFGEDKYRLNGQHTAWARLQRRRDPSLSKPIRWLHYTVKSLEELRDLYERIDKNLGRTKKQRKLTLLAESKGFEGIPNTTLHTLSRAYELLNWSDLKERRKHKPREVAALMKGDDNGNCSKVAHFVTENAGKRGESFVRTAPVVAAMLATFSKSAVESAQFWQAVIAGTNFTSKSEPRSLLRTLLLQKPRGPGKTRAVLDEQTLQYCLVAWNLWRDGKTVSALRLPKDGIRPTLR